MAWAVQHLRTKIVHHSYSSPAQRETTGFYCCHKTRRNQTREPKWTHFSDWQAVSTHASLDPTSSKMYPNFWLSAKGHRPGALLLLLSLVLATVDWGSIHVVVNTLEPCLSTHTKKAWNRRPKRFSVLWPTALQLCTTSWHEGRPNNIRESRKNWPRRYHSASRCQKPCVLGREMGCSLPYSIPGQPELAHVQWAAYRWIRFFQIPAPTRDRFYTLYFSDLCRSDSRPFRQTRKLVDSG